MPAMRLACGGLPELLFCENETNSGRLWGHKTKGYFKDCINDYVAHGSMTRSIRRRLGPRRRRITHWSSQAADRYAC